VHLATLQNLSRLPCPTHGILRIATASRWEQDDELADYAGCGFADYADGGFNLNGIHMSFAPAERMKNLAVYSQEGCQR
jgi:hypothetical protein